MVLVTASRCLVGRCVHYPGKGWRFLPSVSNHKPSTRYWPEANDCIPAWAMKISDEMLTAREWERIREQHADKTGWHPHPTGRAIGREACRERQWQSGRKTVVG